MKLDLSELNGLSETDLEQIDQWLDEFSYRKTARLASQKFNRPIGKRTIERFANRAAPKDFLDDSPEAQETATQILQFAASGQTKFNQASVHVLEQTAFKLTLVCTRRKEDMQALNQISTMLFRHRNAAVRERTAAVQEQKVKLREREIILKETIATTRSSPGRADAPSASEDASAEQYSPPRTFRIVEPYKCPIDALWLECGENKEKFVEAFKSKNCAPTYIITHIDSDDWPQEKREAIKEARQWQDVCLRQKSDERHARYLRERSSSPSSAAILAAGDGGILLPNSNSQTLKKEEGQGEGSPQSKIANPKSKIEDSVRDHLHRRALEWQRNGKYIRPTIYRECPCGKQTPCPDHGPFPEIFWQLSPWSADLADILMRKGLPYIHISLEPKETQ